MPTPEEDAFLAEPNTAVIATVDAEGRAHAVPVWYLYRDGTFRIITGRGSAKHRHILRTGRAALCVDERGDRFRHITAEGPVTVIDEVTYSERLALHSHYRGPEAAERIVSRGGHEAMVLLVLTPERWLAWG
jgi:PPOX class probable F420-dependent enzyme